MHQNMAHELFLRYARGRLDRAGLLTRQHNQRSQNQRDLHADADYEDIFDDSGDSFHYFVSFPLIVAQKLPGEHLGT
jgi:hypothetical protein